MSPTRRRMNARMRISPTSAEPTIRARTWAASKGSAVQPWGPARPEASIPAPASWLTSPENLTGAMASDRRLTIETITTYHVNRALEHEPSRRVALARLENDFARGKITRRAARKALGCLDLRSIEHGKHLVMARLDEAHARSPVGIATAPFLTRKTRDSPLQVRKSKATGRIL